MYARRVASIEYGEAHTIEPHQAVHSSEPEITIRSLTCISNDVLRQAIVRGPGIYVVLSNCGGNWTKEENRHAKANVFRAAPRSPFWPDEASYSSRTAIRV